MAKEKVKKPFYKKWWVWLIAIIIIGAAASGGEEEVVEESEEVSAEPKEETTTEEKPEEKKEEKKEEEKKEIAKIGDNVKVGDVVFTINSKETTTNVGGEYGENAQGIFLILDVTVKNEGKEAITTDSNFFKLVAGDTEYEASGTAGIYINDDGGFFLQEVNPGIENNGKIVFDVPEDVANSSELLVNVQTGFWGTEQGQIQLTE